MTTPAPRAPAFQVDQAVTWRAGRVLLRGIIAAAEWDGAQHTYYYRLTQITGAAISGARIAEPALHEAPTPTKETEHGTHP